MKKLFLLALVCSIFTVGTANAQEEKYYGGEKGSFAITVGADPVINFVGNMFNGTENNSLEGLGGTLAAKYLITDQFALKAGISFNNNKNVSFTFNPEDVDYKELIGKDIQGNRTFGLNLGAQYNFRPGKRLQPFVGADLFYGRYNSYTTEKSYEAEYEDQWGDEINIYDEIYKESSPINTVGVVANLGVEFFFAKNFSISAALDLGLSSSTAKEVSKFKTDDRDYDNEYIETYNYKKKTNRYTRFATGLMNGNIAFNFYF